ncbi:MAG: hypothetical protein R2762_15355 [Bryobacteraceae bacterium]
MKRLAPGGPALLLALGVCVVLAGQQRRGGRRASTSETFRTNVPAHSFDLILGRPEARSMTATVLSYDDLEVYLNKTVLPRRTPFPATDIGRARVRRLQP